MFRLFAYAITFILDLLLCGLYAQRVARKRRFQGWTSDTRDDLIFSIIWGGLSLFYLISFVMEGFGT